MGRDTVTYLKLEISDEDEEIFKDKILFFFQEDTDERFNIVIEENEFNELCGYCFFSKIVTIDFLKNFSEYIAEWKDVTEDFLSYNWDKEFFNSDYNQVRLDNFLSENLEKDHVLDKILKHGMESLTELDKKILSK